MDETLNSRPFSIDDFLSGLLSQEIGDAAIYDQEIAGLIREHLGQESIHSSAGRRLAEALIQLAKERSKEPGT